MAELTTFYRLPFDDPEAAKFKRVRQRVEYLLSKYPASRENDLYLTWLYWRIFDKVNLPYLDFDLFYKMTEAETISRRRREIQNDAGELLPSDSVLEHRTSMARRGHIQ